jgi:hypothetical protein
LILKFMLSPSEIIMIEPEINNIKDEKVHSAKEDKYNIDYYMKKYITQKVRLFNI